MTSTAQHLASHLRLVLRESFSSSGALISKSVSESFRSGAFGRCLFGGNAQFFISLFDPPSQRGQIDLTASAKSLNCASPIRGYDLNPKGETQVLLPRRISFSTIER